MDVVVQASETGLFRRRKKYHTPPTTRRRPRTLSNEPSAMATTDLDPDFEDGVGLAIDEAMMGSCKVEVDDGEEDEEPTFVASV